MPTALAAAVTKTIDGREVIVAIVGGTMLTLALTRPQLRWMANITRGNKHQRLWAERALTGFSFVMLGYAGAAVWIALYRQLDPQTSALLRGAAYFLLAYAGLVHFEPFVNEWRLRTGLGAFVLYAALMLWAMLLGTVIAEYSLTSTLHLVTGLLTVEITALVGLAWLFYRVSARLGAAFDRQLDAGADALARRLGLKRPDEASADETAAPTRTPARSTRA